ncbi:MAG: response regulator [Candidatus Nanopelagicales bacterium]
MAESTFDRGTINVAVIDDHLLIRDGLVAALRQDGFVVTYAGVRPSGLLDLDPPVPVDVVLLDLDLGTEGVATVADVSAMAEHGWRVLIVSAMADVERVREFLRAEVAGFVPKWEPHETLVYSIIGAAGGADMTSREVAGIIASDDDPRRPTLSDQELRALQLYASGMKMASVARQMNVSIHTAKEYIARVRAKYAAAGRPAHTKTALYREALRDHLVEE